MYRALLDSELLDPDSDPAATSSSLVYPEPALNALDLLSVASRAAASVASEQGPALEAAMRLLARAAANDDCIWIVGAAATELRRALQAAGYRAQAWPERETWPARFAAHDLLLACVGDEAPDCVAEAQRRRAGLLVLGGPARIERTVLEASLRVPCYDPRALQLAQTFIVMALCAEPAAARAESAA